MKSHEIFQNNICNSLLSYLVMYSCVQRRVGMETILFITQLASCITAVVAVLTLLIKPIREKILKTDKESEGEKCLLRSEMLKIYYKHVDEQTIRQYELENFIKLYEAYRSLGGNSFIIDVYNEILTWKVIS